MRWQDAYQLFILPRRENELGVGVCSYELRDERGGWQVADGLAVAEKLIPFLFPEGVALALEFGEECLTPEVDVRGVSKRQSIWYVSSKP